MQNVLGWIWDDEYGDPCPEFPVPAVGDVLRVREDLNIRMSGVVDDMVKYAGREVVVKQLYQITGAGVSSVYIDVDNGAWNWFYYCFESPKLEELDPPEEEDFLRFIGAEAI